MGRVVFVLKREPKTEKFSFKPRPRNLLIMPGTVAVVLSLEDNQLRTTRKTEGSKSDRLNKCGSLRVPLSHLLNQP